MRGKLVTAMGGIALLAGAVTPAVAAGPRPAAVPRAKSIHRHFTELEAGVQLSATANRFEDTFRIKSSPFGAGTTIRDATLAGDTFPASGKDTATSYYGDGRLIANETFTLGTPHVDGRGPITGTGTCRSGTFKHQRETCTYTMRGSYDLVTGVTFMTLRGTYTPPEDGSVTRIPVWISNIRRWASSRSAQTRARRRIARGVARWRFMMPP